ncbi:cdkn1a interacting zinc finger protein 1a isoform X2 [Lampris incognitus]|nr:cdkn1a interacting zinc finger protein 1a isoform X2 [Lampris incognitus]
MHGSPVGGQQFRRFFPAGARSSLLGPVPMGMPMRSSMMGYHVTRHVYPDARYNRNNSTASTSMDMAARQQDRKKDNKQSAAGGGESQSAASSTIDTNNKAGTDGAGDSDGHMQPGDSDGHMQPGDSDGHEQPGDSDGHEQPGDSDGHEQPGDSDGHEQPGDSDGHIQPTEEIAEEPVSKKMRTEGSEELNQESIAESDIRVPTPEYSNDTENCESVECSSLEEGGLVAGSEAVVAQEESSAAEVHGDEWALSPPDMLNDESQSMDLALEHTPEEKGIPLGSQGNQEDGKEQGVEEANKFCCGFCGITCHNQQDGWSPQTDVTLNNMAPDEEYNPDTVYGSKFLVPVAGFICRLCNKFYIFESSAPHSHCKSLKHFENLKKYSSACSQAGNAEGSRKCTTAQAMQPTINIVRIKLPSDTQPKDKKTEPTSTPQDIPTSSASTSFAEPDHDLNSLEETPSQASVSQANPSELSASSDELGCEAAVAVEEAKKKNKGTADTPQKSITGKGKARKRKSGRVAAKH